METLNVSKARARVLPPGGQGDAALPGHSAETELEPVRSLLLLLKIKTRKEGSSACIILSVALASTGGEFLEQTVPAHHQFPAELPFGLLSLIKTCKCGTAW